MQAAFEPHGGAELRFTCASPDGSERREIGRLEAPPLPAGAAVRWAVRLEVPESVNEVALEVLAPLSDRSERVRPPWKLLETIEQRTVDPLWLTIRSDALAEGARVFAGPLIAGAIEALGSGPSGTMRHAPRVHSPNLMPIAIRKASAPHPIPGLEVVWKPGDPPPDPGIFNPIAPLPAPPRTAAPERRRCSECRCELDASDVRVGCCPACGAIVAD